MRTDQQRKKHAALMRAWRAKNVEKSRASSLAYYYANKERVNNRQRKNNAKAYSSDPGKWVEYAYRCKYGLEPGDVQRMRKRQGHKCAICRKRKKLNVDHCHKTGRVRGLLCTSCNTALGAFGDSVKVVNVALTYLKRAA